MYSKRGKGKGYQKKRGGGIFQLYINKGGEADE